MRVTTDLKGFSEVSKALKTLDKRVFPDIKKLFEQYGRELQRRMVLQSTGGKLKRRSGEMARGWVQASGGINLKSLFSEVQNAVKYVAIHQFGGVIRARSSKFLTIPTDQNKTPAGVARVSARQLFQTKKAFVRGGVIFENRGQGKNRKPVPMFILKKEVRIPKRLMFLEQAEALAAVVLNKMKGFFK